MKRFYEGVEVRAAGEGYRIFLDQKPLRTTSKRPLDVPEVGLAKAIAEEWAVQGETLVPGAMPHTRLAVTVIDRMPELRATAVKDVLAYLRSDLVCYRAAGPMTLVARQLEIWQPLLDWARERYRLQLEVTTALLPIAQPDGLEARLRPEIEVDDDWRLVGLHAATTALGSIVLGLALRDGQLAAETAFTAGLLDELFEQERFGTDDETAARHEALRRDLRAAVCVMGAGATSPSTLLR